jgi:hypothetical protein
MLNKLLNITKRGKVIFFVILINCANLIFLYMLTPSVLDESVVLRMGLTFTSVLILFTFLTFLKIVVKILTQAADKRKMENE